MFDMPIIEQQFVIEKISLNSSIQQTDQKTIKSDYIFKVCQNISYGYGYTAVSPVTGLRNFLRLSNEEMSTMSWKVISLPKHGALNNKNLYIPNGKFEGTDKVEFLVTYKNKTYRVISTLLVREFIDEYSPLPCKQMDFSPRLIPMGRLNLDINDVSLNISNKIYR
jgi:hypothetical protein